MRHSADRFPFIFWMNCQFRVWWLWVFCIWVWGGVFLAFLKFILIFLLFKAVLLDERDKFAGQDTRKMCEDSKVKKRSPLPKGKHKTRTMPSQEGQRLSRKYHPPSPFAQLFPLQELGWRSRSRSMTQTASRT